MAADLKVALVITADGKGVTATVERVKRDVAGLGVAGAEAGDQIGRGTTAAGVALQSTGRAARDLVAQLTGTGAVGTRTGREIGLAAANAGRNIQSLQNRALGLGKTVAATFGIALGVGLVAQITGAADAYTNLNSRIRLVTDSQTAANVVADEVFAIAQRTRSDLTNTGLLYSSLARSTADLNLRQSQLAQITETVNQSFIVSGASTESARAAITQLTQGLSSGALRGDEFNSVAEQAPIIMDLVARSLGKTRGELREFAAEGGITAEILSGALLNGAEQVQQKMDGMALTISGAGQQLGNAFTRFIGQAGEATAASVAIAAAISFVADNFNGIALAALAVGAILGGRLLAQLGASALGWAANTLNLVAFRASMLGAASASPVLVAGLRAVTVSAGTLAGVLGPVSLALAALAVGYSLVSSAAANDPFRTTIDSLDRLTEKLNEATERKRLLDQGFSDAEIAEAAPLEAARQTVEGLRERLVALQQAHADAAEKGGVHTRAIAVLEERERALKVQIDEAEKSVRNHTDALVENAGVIDQAQVAAKRFADGSKTVDEKLREQIASLRVQVETALNGAKAGALLEAQQQTGAKSADDLSDSTRQLIGEMSGLKSQLDAVTKAGRAKTRSDTELDRAQRTVAQSMAALADGTDQLAAATGGELAKANADHIAALRKIAVTGGVAIAAAAKLTKASALQAQVQEQVTARIIAEAAAHDRNVAVLTAEAALRSQQLGPLEELLAGIDAEIEALGATGEARDRVIEQQQIEADVMRVVTDLQRANIEALKSGTAQTNIDVEAIRKRIAAKREELGLEQAQEQLRSQGGSFGFLGGEDGKTLFAGGTFQELLGNSVKNAFDVGNIGGFFDGFGQAFKARVGEAGVQTAERVANNIGGALNFVGTAISAIKEEGVVGGLLTVAQQIPGIVGAIATGIKTAIGIFGALFGKKPKLVLSGSAFAGSEATGETALGNIFLDNDRTKIDSQQILGAVQAFDQAIADAVSSFDGGSAQIEQISARLATFTSRLKGGDANPEELLKERFAAILGTFDTVIQDFVNKGIGLEAQVKRLTEILGAEQVFNASDLGVEFHLFVEIAEDIKKGGESIADAAQRIVGSVDLLESIADRTGVVFDATGEAFLRLAADVSGILGGLDKATALVNTFFSTFFTETENAQARVQTTQSAREEALTGLGLDVGISNEDFKAQFLAALPTATPEQIADWLRAGAAISAAGEAQATLNAIYERANQAVAAYTEGVTEIADELLRTGLTEFGSEIRDINQWADNARTELNDLARAAGLSAASEEDLAAVHQLAALKAGEAMRKLRERALDLVGQLQGTRLDELTEQIALIEQANQAQLDGIDAVSNAAADSANAQIEAQRRIRDFVDGILRNPALGGLRPKDALPIAQQQLQELFAAAVRGDQSALEQFPQLSEEILRLAQSVFPAGSDPFNGIRDGIIAMGNQLAGQAVRPGAQVGGGGGGIQGPSGDLQSLLDERDALLAAQAAENRLQIAQDLAAAVRDLVIATGEPLSAIAEQIGLSVAGLVADLGVNLEELTDTTAAQLTGVAQQMGVNLSELSAQVGVDLGDLADAQSLLNNALEAQINGLPDEQRDALAPLLANVEAAAALGDVTGLEAAQAELEEAVGALAPSLRDRLAPFFDRIDPTNFTQLDALSFIDQNGRALLTEAEFQTETLNDMSARMDQIRDRQRTAADTNEDLLNESVEQAREQNGALDLMLRNLRAANDAQGFASFAVGTGNVPRTGLATIHQGEAILPVPVADFFRRAGIPVNTSGGGDITALLAEMRAVRAELESANRMAAETARRIAELERSSVAGSRELVAATERQTNTMRTLR